MSDMVRNVIIDGPDGVGKSTLARRLQREKVCRRIKHLSRLPNEWRVTDYEDLLKGSSTVFDRFHYSEPVYAEAAGRAPLWGPESVATLNHWLRVHRTFTIIIHAESNKLLEKRCSERDEMYDIATIYRANELFSKLAETGMVSVGQNNYGPFHFDFHITAEELSTRKGKSEVVRALKESADDYTKWDTKPLDW